MKRNNPIKIFKACKREATIQMCLLKKFSLRNTHEGVRILGFTPATLVKLNSFRGIFQKLS